MNDPHNEQMQQDALANASLQAHDVAAATDAPVDARAPAPEGALPMEEAAEDEEGAIERTIGEGGIGDGDRRRRCGASGAALGASLPGNGQASVATLARRGVGLSLRAICVVLGRGLGERGRVENQEVKKINGT